MVLYMVITASREGRQTMAGIVKKTAKKVFVPITVGGGIDSVKEAKKVFAAGADKISINTAAMLNPELVRKLSQVYGNQAVVVAIDARRRGSWFECSAFGGTQFMQINAVKWAVQAEALGAGEILLTSMDKDGTKKGFDLDLTKRVSKSVKIPVIASGGAGKPADFAKVLTQGNADAVLAAGVFHYGKYSVSQVKQYLKEKGVVVRP